ncbi:MAG: M64 family metallopeptidase, partial [Longimicrobiales bacterium]
TPHELGHSLGRLQDEYTYRARGVAGDAYDGEEPNSIHHTVLTEEQMRVEQRKWWRWLGEPSESGGTIGRYPGGQSRTSGIWRPSRHSMMISLGYYFDQVSRERMAARISSQVELISASNRTDAPLRSDEVVWVETAHPVYHELVVTWQVDGQPVPNTRNSRSLDLNALRLGPGPHTVGVEVVDPTEFVRDAVVRDTSFTATRSWTVSAELASASNVPVAFTMSTDTTRAVGGTDVVYVETTHPTNRVQDVTWRLDGRVVSNPANGRALNVAALNLSSGTHRLSATVTAPGGSSGESQTLSWTVDNAGPTVEHTLSEPVTSIERPDGSRHYFFRDQFTMKLDAVDDQPGYVVSEFRVNGDGWHHYYGWPDASPGSPFLFTPRGTTIKELVYGSLSAEGLSPQPWEPREPGWGTHLIEYRARDAAGNIGATNAFKVTFTPSPTCTTVVTGEHAGELAVRSGVICVDRATVSGPINVSPGASLFVANATINGAVTTSGAVAVELIGTTVDGTVRIGGTTGSVTLFGSVLNREVVLSDNRTAASAILAGNRLGSTLTCDGNTMSIVDLGAPNAVRAGVAVQCPMPEPGRPE